MRPAERVFILEAGCYEGRHIVGVYASPELAMAAGKGNWTMTVWTDIPDWPKLSRVEHYVSWNNDLDWEDRCTISAYSIERDGPKQDAAKIQIQTLRPSDGGWDYLPISRQEAGSYL